MSLASLYLPEISNHHNSSTLARLLVSPGRLFSPSTMPMTARTFSELLASYQRFLSIEKMSRFLSWAPSAVGDIVLLIGPNLMLLRLGVLGGMF